MFLNQHNIPTCTAGMLYCLSLSPPPLSLPPSPFPSLPLSLSLCLWILAAFQPLTAFPFSSLHVNVCQLQKNPKTRKSKAARVVWFVGWLVGFFMLCADFLLFFLFCVYFFFYVCHRAVFEMCFVFLSMGSQTSIVCVSRKRALPPILSLLWQIQLIWWPERSDTRSF